jgi:hypothetical protein
MPSSVESDIRSRVEAFVEEITSMIRTSALEVVSEALGEGGSRPAARGGRARAAAAPVVSSGRRAKGAKRDPRLLQALTDKLGDYIKKNPGLRIEQIGKALGTPTKDLALPVKKLIAGKKISTKGQKRATTYFAK